MFDWVSKGGRKDFTCSLCGKPVPKGEPHFTKRGGKDLSRFHEKCLPENATIGIGKDETGSAPTTEPEPEPVPAPEPRTEDKPTTEE